MSSVSSSRSPKPYAPWLDLPAQLTELILERLPVSDYIRVAAVCKRWQSIQQQHRLRHAPNPPPMLPLPWLVLPEFRNDYSILCYSLFKQRTYRLPVPVLVAGRYRLCRVFPNGLLLLCRRVMKTSVFFVVNPVSKAQIQLPPVTIDVGFDPHCFAAMSSPSSADFALLINEYGALYLFQPGELQWTKMAVPLQMDAVVVCEGKFYCMHSRGSFLVVDPHPQPTIEMIGMDKQQLHLSRWNLVECCGDLLMVKAVEVGDISSDLDVCGFDVFRADLVARKWMRVEHIGDRMLLFLEFSCTSVLASDVGGRGNCIYFNSGLLGCWNRRFLASWSLFDLGTGRVSHMALPDSEPETGPRGWPKMTWMLPSMC